MESPSLVSIVELNFFNKQLSKRCLVGMSQTVIFMIIRLVTLSVNIFLCNWACALTSESLFQIRKDFSWFLIKFALKMNSRKKGTGSEVNITLTMIWCQYSWSICPNFRVVQYGFLLHFDTDNCLLKKFHYTT
jgi:hypothetical protein